MLFSKIAFLLLFLLTGTGAFAQDIPKTIDELFQIKSGTCDFYDDSGKFIEERMEKMVEMVVESPDFSSGTGNMTGKSPLKPDEELTGLFSDFQKATKILTGFSPKDKVLKNGHLCFFENGKWGLKNSQDKVIVKAKFDYVFPDTINGGFAGFTGATCNYYDGTSGKKQLNEDFYWIESAGKNVFIVRSKKGYGLLKDGKPVIEPVKQLIRKESNGYDTYFRIVDKQTGTSILRDDFKTQIPFATEQNPMFTGKDFVLGNNNIFNLKTGKKLICENGFYFKLISAEKQLAAIQKAGENFYYLIDFAGNMITSTKFSRLEMITGSENAIAAVFDKTSLSRQPPEKFGLINPQGQWIIEPENKFIALNWQSDFLILTTSQNLQGLIDYKGQTVIPAEYSSVKEISNGRYLCTIQTKSATESRIINAHTGKVEKDGLGFHSLREFKVCGTNGHLAGVTGGEQVLDENFQTITRVHERIFSEGEYFVGADFKTTGGASQKRLYDCNGKVVSFSINGENVEVFRDVRAVSKNLFFVYLKDRDEAYFITGSGKVTPVSTLPVGFAWAGLEGFFVMFANGYEKAGMIDAEGKMVIPCELDYLTGFDETGKVCFRLRKDVAGILTSDGALLNNKTYQLTNYLGFGLYRFKEGDQFGVFDASGQILLQPEYRDLNLKDGLISTFATGNAEKLYDITGHPVE